MPLLARGPGFGIKKISVLLALVTYFSMMQYSVRSKILSEKKFFLSTFRQEHGSDVDDLTQKGKLDDDHHDGDCV